jgi:SMODS and SLOG-associating 2TM effector domain family 4
MFELTLLDHLRLTYGQVVARHKTHAQMASRRARWSRGLRAAEALLVAGVAAASAAALSGRAGQLYPIISVLLAGLTLAALLLHLSFDFDGTAKVHAACASRLWRLREQYRALLSDLSDGAIDLEAARRGRDALMHEMHAIYEEAPPEDYKAYQAAAQALLSAGEGELREEEIDAFLAKSLQARFSSS